MIPVWVHHLLPPLSFLLTLLFVSSILRAQRPAGNTMAWLLVIVVLPYLGIPLFLLFSGRKFGTRLQKKAKIYGGRRIEDPEREISSTERILRFSGVPGVQRNRSIELLTTGVEAYDQIVKLIQGAERSIHLTTFIFGNDPVGRSIVDALAAKAAAGVEVKVLVDSLGALLTRHPSFKKFIQAGGKLAYFMPIFHLPFRGRTNLRNHRKLLVVDGRIAVLGGMNLAQEYLGPSSDSKRWVDLGVVVEGESVPDLSDIFLKDWAFATRDSHVAPAPRTSETDRGELRAQVVASGPDVAGDPLYDVLLNAIHESDESIQIVTPYFIPDESLAKALELATKRGVSVRVLIPRQSNHQLADLARGSFVRHLKGVGVEFGFYPRMIHAKAVLVDRKLALLGSANFDMRSLFLNYELGLLEYSPASLEALGVWIGVKYAETSKGLPEAGFWRELLEGMGRAISPIL
jgi:cardiolipin synthase